jgi:vacuolar-type H+-ATPase subunit H
MISSRLTALLVVASVALGGGVLAGCGASDVPGVSDAKDKAQTVLNEAKKETDKQIAAGEADVEKAKKDVANAPSGEQKTQAEEALKFAEQQLDTLKNTAKKSLDQAQKGLDSLN